jgi:hypothetical protein
MLSEAMIFNDQNGGLEDLKKYHAKAWKKDALMRFDPAEWNSPIALVSDRKDEWIVEV